MRKLIVFLKTSLLGGALVVLPAWLAVLLFVKALVRLEVIVKPVSTHLPEGVRHSLIIAILLIIALCLLVGAVLRTTNAPKVDRFVTLGGEPYLIRYNSRLPVVVYTPENVEVRYRVWRAEPETKVIQEG